MNRQTNKFHCDLRHPTKKETNMKSIKRWGIKVNGKWWVESDRKPAVYDKYADAIKDARDFNSLRKRGDEPYTVEEYKK